MADKRKKIKGEHYSVTLARKRRHDWLHQYLAGPKGIRGNPRRAALAVGYQDSPSLDETLADIKNDPEIQEKLVRYFDRIDLTDERIILEYYRMAFSDITRVLKYTPGPDGAPGEFEIDPEIFDGLNEDVSATIQEIKPVTDPEGNVRYAVKLHDKKGALDMLAKYRGLIRTPEINVTLIQMMANLNLAVLSTDELRQFRTTLSRVLPLPTPGQVAPAPEAPPVARTPVPERLPPPERPDLPRNGHHP